MQKWTYSILVSAAMLFGLMAAQAQDNLYANARSLVQRVQQDLRHAARINRDDDKERDRYDNAMKHLSDFDKDLSRNKFDKGKLDDAIEDVKNVVDHNTLDPRGRDLLSQDLRDLRSLRQNRGAGY